MTGETSVGVARVIVAEDDPALLELFSRVLAREGYEVTRVENGQTCIDKVTDGDYDLILCDINMPQKNGLQVLAEAKAIDPDLEVILITGGATVERAIEAVRGGAADFLCKPIEDLDGFVQLAGRRIERRRLRRELNENLADRVTEQTLELREAYQELQGLDRLKDEFLTLVSHELRTPVNGISGFMELLTGNFLHTEEKRTEALEGIRRQAGRLEQVIKDVDWILQLTAAKIAPETKSSELETLVQKQAAKWEPRASEKRVSLQIEICDSFTIDTDALLLENSLDRLLDNAVKFTEHGTITLRLRLQNDQAVLEVQGHWSRNRKGIPRSCPYSTGRRSRHQTPPGGTGFGSSDCQAADGPSGRESRI